MNQAKVVVVTGASAGIGRATAIRFAREGAKVCLIARGSLGLAGAKAEVETEGGEGFVFVADTSDFDQLDAVATQIEKTVGPIDIWINVAFASVFAPFLEIEPAEFRRITETSYLGFVNGTRAAMSRMVTRDRGVIVQVGSALSFRSIPLQSAYCGAKHAINGFTSSLRTELKHQKSAVQITVVQMPAVNTPQFSWVLSRLPCHPQPVPPIYEPEVAAEGVYYAALHPKRKQYLVGAPTLASVWLNKFAAPLLDIYLGKTGYRSQQSDQPADPTRANNLWAPLDGEDGKDYGTRGEFSDRSHSHSYQLWFSQHRLGTSGTFVIVGAIAKAYFHRERSPLVSLKRIRR